MTKIKTILIEKILLFLYLISISAFQLGSGFDAIFVRVIFFVLIIFTLFCSKKLIINGQVKWSLLFWIWYFLSILWANNINDTLYYLNDCIQIIGLSIVLPIIFKEKKDIYVILEMIFYSLVFTSLLIIIRTPFSMWGSERLGSVVGLNPNTLGLRAALSSIIGIFLLHNSKENKKSMKNIIYVIGLIVLIVVVLFTGSKKAILTLFIGFAAFEIVSSKGIKVFIKILLITVGILIGFYLIFNNEKLYSILGRRIERTMLTLLGNASGLDVDMSLNERNFYMESAIELFKENPILGYGGNNFMSYMRNVEYSHVAYSHNNYTELLATLGVVGFTIYYSFWGYIIVKLYKRYNTINDNKYLLLFIINMIIVLMDYGNVSYFNEFNIVLLIISYINLKINKDEEKIRYEHI